jgi:ABC-type nickel/cobalt efflux system permease component RcnA
MPDGSSIVATLLLGFVLGLRHALDADPVAAIVGHQDAAAGPRDPRIGPGERGHPLRRSLLAGLLWGAGHAAVLLVAGGLVLALRARVPDRVAQAFELAVAVMLIGLGARVLVVALRGRVHVHEHDHDGLRHAHLHFHARPHAVPDDRRAGPQAPPAIPPTAHLHPHPFRFALRPLLIGGLHGLAGSAGLALLALTTLPTLLLGCLYLGLFGVGSMLGMAGLSLALGAPLILARHRSARLHRALRAAAGCASLVVGLMLAWEVGVAADLLR